MTLDARAIEWDSRTRTALFAELDAEWPPPALVDETPAGPRLAALLNTVALADVPARVLVEVAAGAARLASWAAATEAAATSALTERVGEFAGVGPGEHQVGREEMAATELGAGLSLSPAAAMLRVGLARSLERLPLTRLALAAGRIDLTKTRAIADTMSGVSDATAAAVEARVIGRAPGQTAAQLRACLRRALISVDPSAAEARRQAKVLDRGVWREALPDGMGRLEWLGPVEEVEGAYLWLTGKAQQSKAADIRAGGPVRTLDQCRSDVLADLGACGLALEELPRRQGRRPTVDVVVSLATLLGADDQPGELAGIGPVTADVARKIAADGTWRRLVTDPRTGRLLDMSSPNYEPPQDIREAVIARDRTCRGIGCRMPAERCDIDHRIPHPAGPTSPDNLEPRCRTDHRVKTLTDTQVEADEHGGVWITLPSGRRYYRPAEPVLDHPASSSRHPTGPDVPDDPDPPSLDFPPF